MALGNSNGNNRGKKYLKSGGDIAFAKQADDFNSWFSKNYNSLVIFLKENKIFNEDIFHETYKNIYDKVFYSGFSGEDFKPYLMRSYYTNHVLNRTKQGRYCDLLPSTEKEDISSEYFKDIENKIINLEKDILRYVYLNYNLRDFELFKMYMSLKPAVNYSTLSKITGVKSYLIQRRISRIKTDIKNNEEFAKRRKELL